MEVVTREELRRQLWPDDVFVDFDGNLNTAIATLRQALCDTADHPHFIETLPKRGYRFLSKVSAPFPAPPRVTTPRAKIVVLPILNLSGDPAQEYLSDAMTDEIITALAGLAPEHLAVIARTTTMHYKGSRKDAARIGRELSVDYLVEGALRRVEDQVEINIQLIQISDQTHVFAKKYDARPGDILNMHNCIAQAVAVHIPAIAGEIRAVQAAGNRLTSKPTKDLVAYTFYLKGRQQFQQMTPDPATIAERAMRYFGDAIARDPQFALAYAAIAEGHWWIGYAGLRRPKEAFTAGVRAALRAIEIGPTLGYPHALLGTFRVHLDHDWAEAGREMAMALQLDPTCPEARFHYATNYLLPQGRIQDAIAELERALESDPLSLYIRFWLGFAFYAEREYARALQQFRSLLELDPGQHPELQRALDFGYAGIGLVHAVEGRLDEAVSALRSAVEHSGGFLTRLGQLGLVLARKGEADEARKLLERLEAITAKAYFSPWPMALIYLGLGEFESALTCMERCIDDSEPNVAGINLYPLMAPLRGEPRFTALLRKMNLEP